MGKFLETKYSGHQNRVIKRHGKSIQRCTADYDLHNKTKKIKRKLYHSKDHEPPCKKLSPEVDNKINHDSTLIQIKSQFQDLEFELKTNISSDKHYLKLVKQDEDLFSDDELKARHDQFTQFNFIFLIFNEIALEGLDGITIEAFWKRLDISLKSPTCMDFVKDYIWHIIRSNQEIMFFELPEPRQDLVIFSRDAYVNKDTNVFMEVYQTGLDIYKVDYAPKGPLWGSCATLTTRVDISEQVRNMTLDEAYSTYKNKLVMVADQKIRLNALLDDLTDPNYEYTQTEYCLLERIGRSRELGEITQGPASLGNCFSMDSKSVYHYCKGFKKENLVTKQFFCLRSTMDQNKIGRLLHLRRFYSKKKSKYMILAESVINYLKKSPGYKAPYNTVKSIFMGPINRKFFKNQEFLRYVNTNVYLPYKEFYPEATFKEYMTKNLVKERTIQMMQLKDPYLNIVACWSDSPHQDSSDEEDDNDDDDIKIGKGRTINMEFIREIYLAIYSTGKKGITTQDINSMFDVDFPTTRSVLRKLVARNLVKSKKFDIGRQKTNQYVATYFIENPNLKVSDPKPTKTGSSSIIEKLKQKQQLKIDSVEKERVYTRDQFEADQQHILLGLEKPSLLPVTFAIPQVICEYLISKIVQSNDKEIISLAQFKAVLTPFKISLTYPELLNDVVMKPVDILPSVQPEKLKISELKVNSKYFYSSTFKPDLLTKAFLLQGHFGNKINRKEVIEFLDPNFEKPKQAVKRGLPLGSKAEEPQATTSQEDGLVNSKRPDLPYYMGSSPVVIWTEKGDEIVSELFMSTPQKAYKTGVITNYICAPDITPTDRVLSRIRHILETVNSCKVFEEVNKFLKIISNKESQEGYDKKMDRKSLHRIINRLIKEGYIKIYYAIICNKTVKKSQNYVCHPDVDHHHEVIRNGIEQIKFRFFCGNRRDVEVVEPVRKKPKPVESSPFVEYDVLQSIQEINELHPPKYVTLKAISSKKAGKLYGFRPKFARMSLVHEVLFYLIYVLDKDTVPLPKEEILGLFRKFKINLTEEDFQQLPPIYCKELSWKMFIPPLPRHQGWNDGWALLCDVILRIPLSLIVRLYCINFLSTELQETLQHPIKRFYLIKNLPSQIQYLVMYRRKCIHDIYLVLVRLAYCGILQFGPSRYKEKDQGFIYLNRKASLLETMTSEPGYHKVSIKDYNSVSFYFNNLENVTKYWFTMHNICMNTLLNARHVVEGKTITLIDVTAKPSLNKALAVKMPDKVEEYDTGEIPGDHRGAAGLDSAMWSHIQKNWFYFAPKSPQSFFDELASLKVDQIMPEQVSFAQLKLPPMPNKFYLCKPQEIRPILSRKVKSKKTSKKLPVVTKLIPVMKRRLHKDKREYYDAVDNAILRKYSGVRFRPSWSEEEDKVLILLKVASSFITPGSPKQVINYTVIRDLLHKILPESRCKTSRTIPRRLKILYRDVPFLANIETLVLNLYKLVPVAQYFVPLRNFILNEKDASGNKFKLSDPEIHNAFIFIAYYMLRHRKEVETTLHGNLTTIDYFNEDNIEYTITNILPFEQDTKHYFDPTTVGDIRKYILKNIFHSALGHKDDHPAWSYQMYKIYQKFSQDVLKSTIEELREQHMIQYKKEPLRKFFTPYKFSLAYVFSQTTTFTYHTLEEAFTAFLDLKNTPEKLQFTSEVLEPKKYGQMFGLNEVITFMLDQVNLKFWLPEHHFVLNPAIEEHGQVIDELAKRYQAKLKSEQREAVLQASTQIDTTYSQIPESEPVSLTTIPEDTETIQFDDEEPLDLTVTSTNSTTITNLKHWISDCIDAERVRSPSPELLNLDVSHEHLDREPKDDEKKIDEVIGPREKEDLLLSLEEIKSEMLKATPTTEKRLVPYITDLVKLLSETFDEIETDEQTIDEMKKHFVQQYPSLEELNVEGFNDHFLVQYLENRPIIKDIWKKIEREAHVVEPSDQREAFDEILEKGGTIEDIALASELILFICEKEVFGATGSEIKEHFLHTTSNCTLDFVLKILTGHNILLRTGICTVTFVHNEFQSPWLADTFVLTDEHVNLFKTKNAELIKLEEDIDQRIKTTQWIKVKALPWCKVDGTLNKDLFKVWLSSVFSYCIENPKTLMTILSDKFCYLKPVDLFYLVEILQDLGCLEMRWCQPHNFDLFLDYEWIQDRKATMLDKFEEIYIEPNQISFNSLGSFFHTM